MINTDTIHPTNIDNYELVTHSLNSNSKHHAINTLNDHNTKKNKHSVMIPQVLGLYRIYFFPIRPEPDFAGFAN